MFVVIMAGGAGTRFWPVSRKKKPKQFLNICGKDPMVVETCDRLKSLARDEEIIIVLGKEHLREARELFKHRKIRLVAEPLGRDTAPCIGLGALYAQHLGCNEPMAFLPADHYIGDTSAFVDSLRGARKIAESGAIVTLGIVPTRPETGYGYIKKSETLADKEGIIAYKVSGFVEKPDPETAEAYLSSGAYFWNAGIFIATPETILQEIRQYLPELFKGLMRLRKVFGKDGFESGIQDVYENLEDISFDYGIMERTTAQVFVVPCECGWSDVGSWASLYELKSDEYDEHQNLVEGETLLTDCKNVFVSNRNRRLVACLGVKNCLVVDTPEALLVADLRRSQDIRKIVEKLKSVQKEELL